MAATVAAATPVASSTAEDAVVAYAISNKYGVMVIPDRKTTVGGIDCPLTRLVPGCEDVIVPLPAQADMHAVLRMYDSGHYTWDVHASYKQVRLVITQLDCRGTKSTASPLSGIPIVFGQSGCTYMVPRIVFTLPDNRIADLLDLNTDVLRDEEQEYLEAYDGIEPHHPVEHNRLLYMAGQHCNRSGPAYTCIGNSVLNQLTVVQHAGVCALLDLNKSDVQLPGFKQLLAVLGTDGRKRVDADAKLSKLIDTVRDVEETDAQSIGGLAEIKRSMKEKEEEKEDDDEDSEYSADSEEEEDEDEKVVAKKKKKSQPKKAATSRKRKAKSQKK